MLWYGAHDSDFTQAPSDVEIATSLETWKSKHPTAPTLPETRPAVVAPEQTADAPAQLPEIPKISHGDLDTIPALDHFTEHTNYSTASFTQLAIELEALGKLQHSLLAWERSIDHCENENPSTAHQAIAQLRKALPIWTADADQSLPLTLHIHTPEEQLSAIAPLTEAISQTLTEASSYIVSIDVKTTSISPREGFPTPPIRLWLSSNASPPKQTPQLTFRFKPEEDSFSLEEQLYLALYRSISGHFLQIEDIHAPVSIANQDTAKYATQTYLTRLHWKKLRDSLFTEPETKPAAVIIIEEEDNLQE